MANHHQKSRNDKQQPNQLNWQKRESFMLPFRRKSGHEFRKGQKVFLKATPPNEIVFRLASEWACQLMTFDRERTTGKGKRSVMQWSATQTTAGLRYIRACAFGPKDPKTGKMLDFSVLTEFQLASLRSVFTIVCASELGEGRALNSGHDVILPGMKQEWYAEQIDEMLSLVEENRGQLGTTLARWILKVHKAELKSEAAAKQASAESAETTVEEAEYPAVLSPMVGSTTDQRTQQGIDHMVAFNNAMNWSAFNAAIAN